MKTKLKQPNFKKPTSKAVVSGAHFIDGEWRGSQPNGKHFENYNPATGERISIYPEASREDVDAAVRAARRAFDSWRKTPVAKRGEILLRAMRILEDRKEAFAEAMTREMGKVLSETRGDVQEAI